MAGRWHAAANNQQHMAAPRVIPFIDSFQMYDNQRPDVGSWMLVGLADSSRCLRRQPVLTNIQDPTSGSVMLRREFLAGAVALALRRDRLEASAALVERATSSGAVSAAAL